jgi:hypothetical protein
MTARLALLSPLAFLVPAMAGPAAAPVTTSYRIETRVEQIQDLSAFGQGEQSIVQEQAAHLTVTLTDSAGGKALHVVVDSMASSGPVAAPAGALEAVRGAWLHGFIDPRGRTRITATSNDSSDVLAQLRASLVTLHPRVPPGTKTGDSWSDTTVVESSSSSQATTTTTVTRYTAGGEEARGAVRARKLEAAFTGTVKGTIQNPMAGELVLEATETGSGTYFIGPDGRYLGGSSSATGNATVSSAMLPAPIPIRVIRSTTVTVLK